jgi:hypothetical protein
MSVVIAGASGAVVLLLLTTAWFQIQAVRLGYKAQNLRQKIDDLEKEEQTIDQRLQQTLSLPRLDELAKAKFGLQVPSPSQIILLQDPVV